MSAKTISIFLPDGNPNGIKIVELTNRTIKSLLIPRTKLLEANNRIELVNPAVYVLCTNDGERVYIGECENFINRIKSHDQAKEFWEVAIAFLSKDGGIDKADVKFVESLAVEQAKLAGRAELINVTSPVRNNLHEFKEQAALEFFEDLKLIITALGFPVFDQIVTERVSKNDLWFCERRATKASAIYDENGFTIIKGSIIDGTEQPSFIERFPFALTERRHLLASNAEELEGGKIYRLFNDITFKSANKAGGFAVGANVNAWTTWKNARGETMDEALRKELNAVDSVAVTD